MELLQKLLEIIFPKRASAALVENASQTEILECFSLTEQNNIISLTAFSSPLVRACIHEAKFYRNETAYILLGELLNIYLVKSTITYLIIPIPLSTQREHERGYNQVTEIVKRALKTHPQFTLKTNILYRHKNTIPQTSLDKTKRIKNMENAFEVRSEHTSQIFNANILLVDDVTTTGATFAAAKKALLPHHPAKVTCLALAH